MGQYVCLSVRMKIQVEIKRTVVAILVAAAVLAGEAKTKVAFFFDTEDFIQPRSADAIRDIANMLASEGVRGHFAMVGYLGKKLVDWRRVDVLDALKPHLVGTQTLYHSLQSFLPGRSKSFNVDAALDALARQKVATLYMHPHMAVCTQHWDWVFKRGNNYPFGEWPFAQARDPADTAVYYDRLRAFIRKLKADDRFEITDCERLYAEQKPRRAIMREDVPARCVVKAADVRRAAAAINTEGFLPVTIDVGGARIGPADFLFAALEILETGADEVAIEPRDQLGDIARYLPKMASVNFRGTWIYSEDFKDEWTSNRLRWQFWTFRYE